MYSCKECVLALGLLQGITLSLHLIFLQGQEQWVYSLHLIFCKHYFLVVLRFSCLLCNSEKTKAIWFLDSLVLHITFVHACSLINRKTCIYDYGFLTLLFKSEMYMHLYSSKMILYPFLIPIHLFQFVAQNFGRYYICG